MFKKMLVILFLATLSAVVFSQKADATAGCIDIHTPIPEYIQTRINNNKSVYKEAASKTGVPWELIAAVHYRETNNSTFNPYNGQGLFQLYTLNQTEGLYFQAGETTRAEFLEQTILAANFLQSKATNVYTTTPIITARKLRSDETDLNLIKNTLFSYNGRATAYANQAAKLGYNKTTHPFEGSPYVMNQFDCDRLAMGIIQYDGSSTISIEDPRMGAFTLYAKLKGTAFWNKLHSGTISEFIVCNGDYYLAESTKLRKRLMTNDAISAWGFSKSNAYSGSSACNYDTYGLELDLTVKSRSSGLTYIIDDGKAYYMTNNIAYAYDVPTASDTQPYVDSDTILDNLTVAKKYLGRIVTSTNEERTDYYLIQDGKRYTVDGTSTNDRTTLNTLINESSNQYRTASVNLLKRYALQSQKVTPLIEVDNKNYIIAEEKLYPIEANSALDEQLTATEQTWNNLPFNTNRQSEIADKYTAEKTHYYINDVKEDNLKTQNELVAKNLGKPAATISNKASEVIKDNFEFKQTNYLGDKNNLRAISCNNKLYVVERYIKRKRELSEKAVSLLGLENIHFFKNDKGCAYPKYSIVLDNLVRSRVSQSVYGMTETGKVVRVDTFSEKQQFGLSDSTFMDRTKIPYFTPKSITDNFNITY